MNNYLMNTSLKKRLGILLSFAIIVFLVCCKPGQMDQEEKQGSHSSTTFLELQSQINQIDSLSQIPNFDAVNNLLSSLLEQESEWSNALNANEFVYVYYWISEFYYRMGEMQKAKSYNENCFLFIDSISDLSFKSEVLNTKAIIEYYLGNPQKGIEYLYTALDQFGTDTINTDIIDLYNNIGNIYSGTKQYDLAAQYFEKLLRLADTLKLESEYGYYHANLGHMYLRMGKMKDGHYHLEIAQNYFIENQQHTEQLFLNALLASIYTDLGDLIKAEKILEGNLEQTYEKNLWELYVETSLSLFELHIAKGEERKAFAYLEQGLEKIHYMETDRLQLKIYEKLIQFYRNNNDYKQAFEYLQRYNELQDSVNEASQTELMRELTVKYQTDRKNDQIAQLQVQNENEQRIKRIYLLIIGLTIVVMIYIFLLLRRISIQKKELEEANRTKDTLFSIIAHDLRSPMIALRGMGDLMTYYIEKKNEEKLSMVGNQVSQALTRINHLLDNLLNWAVSNSNRLDFHPKQMDISDIIEEVIALNKTAAEAKEIRWNINVTPSTLPLDRNMAFSIFNNLISNSIKFSKKEGKLEIIGQAEDKHYHLKISDEAGGMPQYILDQLNSKSKNSTTVSAGSGDNSFGLGLILVKSFIQEHRGSLFAQNNEQGAVVNILLPL